MAHLSDVILEQYKMLREEMVSLIDETRKVEIYTLGGLGAFYAWLTSKEGANEGLWYVATIAVLFGAFRSLTLFVRMGDLSFYMRKIEEDWTANGMRHGGWETHFGGTKPWSLLPSKSNHLPLSLLTILFWAVLLWLTLEAPCFFRKGDDKASEKKGNVTKVEVVQPIRVINTTE